MKRKLWAQAANDDGQITLLAIGSAVLALAVVFVIATASAVHLERARLFALADTLAIDAASAIDVSQFYRAAAAGEADFYLTDQSVRGAVAQRLADHPYLAERFSDFEIGPQTGSTDGVTATVELIAYSRPGFAPWLLTPWPNGIPIAAVSAAQVAR